MSPNRDEVRPLGPARPERPVRWVRLRRTLAVAFGILALLALGIGPILSFVLACVSLVAILDGRFAFGSGRYRATLAFVAAPWIGLAGVALAVLGWTGELAGFLLAPGLLLVAIAILLLAWSFVFLRLTPPEGPIRG